VFVGDILPELKNGIPTEPIHYDYLSGKFQGPKTNVVVLFFNGRCLQVLDPEVDFEQPLLDDSLHEAVAFSNPAMIRTSAALSPDTAFLGEKPTPDWCTWYERADLARQRQEWETVVQIGDEHLDDEPLTFRTSTTYSPFIEAYAHANRWQRSLELSAEVAALTIQSQQDSTPWLCALWTRMEESNPQSPEKSAGIAQFHQLFQCEQ
jgi:hypothetical protein